MRNQNSIFTTLGASNHALEEREQHDYYATDPKAVELLLELEPFAPVIWEPACGEGHISKVLQAHGHEISKLEAQKLNTMTAAELVQYWKIQTS